MRSRLSPSGTPRIEGPRGPLSVMAGIIGSAFYRDKARPAKAAVRSAFATCDRPQALRRDWDRALVVHDLADPSAILVGEARRIGRQLGAGRHAALHRRPLADLLEPAFEIFELVDVLALRLPIDGPRIADHVRDRVLVARHIAALIKAVVENAVEPVGFIGKAAHRIG